MRNAAVLLFVLTVGACSSSDPTTIQAGAEARTKGVVAYFVQHTPEHLTIALLGNENEPIGTLDISTAANVSEAPIVNDDGEVTYRRSQVVRFHDNKATKAELADREVTRGTPGETSYLAFAQKPAWLAALADPALADVLGERQLKFVAGEPSKLRVDPRALSLESEYSGEYPCCGHRVGEDTAHVAGAPFQGCYGDTCHSGDMDMLPVWTWDIGGCKFMEHYLERVCNDACCANGDCMSTSGESPCGLPYGPGGCYVIPNSHTSFEFCQWYECGCGYAECIPSSCNLGG